MRIKKRCGLWDLKTKHSVKVVVDSEDEEDVEEVYIDGSDYIEWNIRYSGRNHFADLCNELFSFFNAHGADRLVARVCGLYSIVHILENTDEFSAVVAFRIENGGFLLRLACGRHPGNALHLAECLYAELCRYGCHGRDCDRLLLLV